MINKFKDDLDEMSYEELDLFVKEIKEYSKDRKQESKNVFIKEVKERLNEGDTVIVTFKEAELEGTVTRIGEKSFSVEAYVCGVKKKVSRQYHLYIRHSRDVKVA